MKKIFLFISLFSITHNMLFSMENNDNEIITIECFDGKVMAPIKRVKKLPIYMPDSTNIDLSHRKSLSTKKLVFLTTKDFQIPAEKSFEQTYKLWKEADFLGISDKKQDKIIEHLITKATTVKQLVDIHKSQHKQWNNHYFTNMVGGLSIVNNPNLRSLSGIEETSSDYKKLAIASNQSLDYVDLDHIFKHFPELNDLFIYNNNLTNIHATYLPSNLVLNITGNKLSTEQIEKLNSLAILPWYKKLYNISFSNHQLIGILPYTISSYLIGAYAADKIGSKFQLDQSFVRSLGIAIAVPLSLGMGLFDLYRFRFPYKPAEIIADTQKNSSSYHQSGNDYD
jgi:hypothetical protein